MYYVSNHKLKHGELIALAQDERPLLHRALIEHSGKSPLSKQVGKSLVSAIECSSPTEPIIVDFGRCADFKQASDDLTSIITHELRGNLTYAIDLFAGKERVKSARNAAAFGVGYIVLRSKIGPNNQDPRLQIASFLAKNSLDSNEVALILDFGDVRDIPPQVLPTVFENAISKVSQCGTFESITVMATSFPEGMGKFTNGWHHLHRPEFDAWEQLVTNSDTCVAFGDYGPRSSAWPPEGRSNPIAQVRYTTPDGYLLYRGKSLIQKGFDQMITIGGELASRDEFFGSDYSWGDAQMEEIGIVGDRTGNRTTWIAYETSHHVRFTAEQVAETIGL